MDAETRRIFMQANTFYESADSIGGYITPNHLAIPGIVLCAFSIELNLKTIVVANGKEAWGHHLGDLFELIPEDDKKHLEAEWSKSDTSRALLIGEAMKKKIVSGDFKKEDFNKFLKPKNMRECIKASSLAFQKFRYQHEARTGIEEFSVGKILPSLAEMTLQKYINAAEVDHIYPGKMNVTVKIGT